MTPVEVTRTFLEMTRPEDLVPACSDDADLVVQHAERCPASFYRYLYVEVGRAYHWLDRLAWTDDQIRAHLQCPQVELWVLYASGAPAGYFELLRHPDRSTEVAYFGLLPEFHGRGLGKHLLTVAVQRAWEGGTARVWLHTCTLDGSAALPNYLKRGFRRVRQETYWTEIPVVVCPLNTVT